MAHKFEYGGLDHVVLRVRSLEKSLVFYRDILGCAVERELAEVGLTQLRAGASLIDLVPVDGQLGRAMGAAAADDPAVGGRNMDHFALSLEVFDGEAIARYLDDHNVPHGPVERRYGAQGFGPSIYLDDPDGNVVELKGPPD